MKYANAQFAISSAAFAALIALTWYSLNVGWTWLVISYVYYKVVVGLPGNQIDQHRYFSHRSFATTSVKEWMLYFLSLTTVVNPVLYALVHRHHHCHKDHHAAGSQYDYSAAGVRDFLATFIKRFLIKRS
jgi:fatty-acid desaturase